MYCIVTKYGFLGTFSELVSAEAQKVTVLDDGSNSGNDDDQGSSPSAKMLRLFSGYKKSKKSIVHGSVKAELIHYMQLSGNEEDEGCLDFCQRHRKTFPRLYLLAMRVLAVPATSAAVREGVQSWWDHHAPS